MVRIGGIPRGDKGVDAVCGMHNKGVLRGHQPLDDAAKVEEARSPPCLYIRCIGVPQLASSTVNIAYPTAVIEPGDVLALRKP